jgi:AbrB family looped-hinge helix DNA binding protein
MHFSTLTSKGQTTIPKEIREFLHLKPEDKIVYIPDGKRVFLTHINGTILDLKGLVEHPAKRPINFPKLREEMKEKVAFDLIPPIKRLEP